MSDNCMYLITGGCGFIGSHIAEALVREGCRVRILDNLSSGHLRNIAAFRERVEFMAGDLRNLAEVDSAMSGITYVFHQAALVSVFDSVARPRDNHEINITGTLNVLEAARAHGVRRLAMASTAAVYGNEPTLPKREDMRPEPASPYAIGKITGEYMLQVYAALYGLETVALRYFNVYGPRQDPSSVYSGVISKFTDALISGQTPCIFGDGGQTRDFVFVRDVVQANLRAMRASAVGHGEVFNVGTGRRVSLLELLAVLGTINGRQVEPLFKDARAGDIRHSLPDISRAQSILGYAPSYSLEQGLRELVESVRRVKIG